MRQAEILEKEAPGRKERFKEDEDEGGGNVKEKRR